MSLVRPTFLAILLVLASADRASGAERWARPVDGEVVEAFDYDAAAPFAGGQHRGVDFASRPGEAVRAPCSGPVTFAGRVPDRGRGVTIRCGVLAATLVELRAARVSRGTRVVRSETVGRAGRRVHLGARRAGRRFGYIDPLALLGGDLTPLGPAPAPTRRPPRAAPRLAPAPPVRPRRAATPGSLPTSVWIGLGLVAAGLPLGAVVGRRRRAGVRRVGEAVTR